MQPASPITEERKSSFNKSEILRHAHGQLFPNLQARLPLPNMLMFDRITHIDSTNGAYGHGLVEAELDINPDLWFFACHFEGDPVMPGCLGLDALWQLSGFFLSWLGAPGRGRALGANHVKFFGQILPSSKLVRYVVDIKRVRRHGLTLVVSDGTVFVDQKKIYTATDLKVGLFTENTLFVAD